MNWHENINVIGDDGIEKYTSYKTDNPEDMKDLEKLCSNLQKTVKEKRIFYINVTNF